MKPLLALSVLSSVLADRNNPLVQGNKKALKQVRLNGFHIAARGLRLRL